MPDPTPGPEAGTDVALVLAGGGARGAYEIGALAEILPALEDRGERVRIVVGTSVGALNAAWLAANAHRPLSDALTDGLRAWQELAFHDVLRPLVSLGGVAQVGRYLGEVAGIPGLRLRGLLDPEPLAPTVRRLVSFGELARNVDDDTLRAAAVVATSAASGRTVVFHHGGGKIERDTVRGIDYVPATLADEHVRASAAIPAMFPAVHVAEPAVARGWYFDGGTRLNTPIKPALALGARRVVVIGLNSTAGAPDALAGEAVPDVFDGAAQLVQAVLADPLAHDVRTLASVNALLEHVEEPERVTGRRPVPYVFVAPARRDAIGAIAREVFERHYAGKHGACHSPDVALLGRLVCGAADPIHGELLSYLLFAPEFAAALIARGRADAQAWLTTEHDDGPWRLGPLPRP